MEVYKGVEQPPTFEQRSRIPKNNVSGNSSMVSLRKKRERTSRKSVKRHQRTMHRKSTAEVIRSKDVPALFVS
jgi:hypothetical protein